MWEERMQVSSANVVRIVEGWVGMSAGPHATLDRMLVQHRGRLQYNIVKALGRMPHYPLVYNIGRLWSDGSRSQIGDLRCCFVIIYLE